MTEAERIRKEATKFATFETAPNEMEKYNELYSGYIAGATAEHERLQQQIAELKSAQELIKEKDEKIQALQNRLQEHRDIHGIMD